MREWVEIVWCSVEVVVEVVVVSHDSCLETVCDCFNCCGIRIARGEHYGGEQPVFCSSWWKSSNSGTATETHGVDIEEGVAPVFLPRTFRRCHAMVVVFNGRFVAWRR